MGFRENLKQFRVAAKLTQEQLALACGFPGQSRIANYENGSREPAFDDLSVLSKALGVSQSDLLGHRGAKKRTEGFSATKAKPYRIAEAKDGDGALPVTLSTVRASCGGGSITWDDEDRHAPLLKESRWFQRYKMKPKDALAVWADGNSMADFIVDGDIVIFDTSKTIPRTGRIFLVHHPDGMRIKRLRRDIDGTWVLESDNKDKKAYPDERISAEHADLLKIKGEFVYRQGG